MAGAVRQVGEAKFFADGRGLMQRGERHRERAPDDVPKRRPPFLPASSGRLMASSTRLKAG